MSIFRFAQRLLGVVFLTSFLLQCSSVSTQAPSVSPSPATSDEFVAASSLVFFATDYQSPGQIGLAATDGNTLEMQALSNLSLGTSAIIRVFGDRLYIVHDGFSTFSSDNLQVVDLNTGTTVAQYSVGNGTNPHDVAVVGNTAYISLYNPGADPLNIDTNGQPADLILMDLSNGNITQRISFEDYLEDDGDKNANADHVFYNGDKIFVLLQDLDANTFAASASGKLAVLNPDSQTLETVIELQGRNPVGIATSDEGRYVFVSHMATYNAAVGNFDIAPVFGGVECVDLQTESTTRFFSDNALGGYVERVRFGNGELYVVASRFEESDFTFRSRIVQLTPANGDLINPQSIDDTGTDIRELAYDNGFLWISRRQINTSTGLSEPRLDVLNLATNQSLSPATNMIAPAMSFSIIP